MASDDEIASVEPEEQLREASIGLFESLGFEVYTGNVNRYKQGDILGQQLEYDPHFPNDLAMVARVFEIGQRAPWAVYTKDGGREIAYLLLPSKAKFRTKNLMLLREDRLVPGPKVMKDDVIKIKLGEHKIPVKVKDIKWNRKTGDYKYLFDYDDYGDESSWVPEEELEMLPATDIVESVHVYRARTGKMVREMFASGALV